MIKNCQILESVICHLNFLKKIDYRRKINIHIKKYILIKKSRWGILNKNFLILKLGLKSHPTNKVKNVTFNIINLFTFFIIRFNVIKDWEFVYLSEETNVKLKSNSNNKKQYF